MVGLGAVLIILAVVFVGIGGALTTRRRVLAFVLIVTPTQVSSRPSMTFLNTAVAVRYFCLAFLD